MLLGCAAATCRGVWLSCSYTEELPRDKQPQVQELPGWEYNHYSSRTAMLLLLSSSWTQRLMGIRLCTHIHVWTHSPVPGILQAKQKCQRNGKRKCNPQELNSKCKRAKGMFTGWALSSGLLICLPIPHTPCSPSPVFQSTGRYLFCGNL